MTASDQPPRPRDDLVERSAPFLPTGSEIQQVFIAQTAPSFAFFFITYLKALVGTMPRHTQLGPVSGRWGQVQLLGERHWVHKRFHPAIAAADREAGFTP